MVWVSAIRTIVMVRLSSDPETQAYAARRAREGKLARKIRRCLKRYLARQFHRQLTANPPRGNVPISAIDTYSSVKTARSM